MKTLDEVIEALTVCTTEPMSCDKCPYYEEAIDCCPDNQSQIDALHYLKEYRDIIGDIVGEALEKKRDYYVQLLQKTQQLEDNPPLTWDELKEMRGQPVWVEIMNKDELPALDSRWGIATGPYVNFSNQLAWSQVGLGSTYELQVKDYGKTWQVYRKERTNAEEG